MLKTDGKLWVSADYPHIRIPKRMLNDQQYIHLSAEAKLIYAAMMDRTSLSYKNQNGFKNSNGEIFIFFSQIQIMNLLNCGHDKASKVQRELIDANLIKVTRRGIGKPYEIVVYPTDWRLLRETKNEQSDNSMRNSEKTDYSLCGKIEDNNTEYSNHEIINPEYYLRRYLMYEIEYDELIQEYNPKDVNKIVDVAVSTICQETESVLVGNVLLSADKVKQRLRELKKDHVWNVLKKIKDVNFTNEHLDKWILNTLYESIMIQVNKEERNI